MPTETRSPHRHLLTLLLFGLLFGLFVGGHHPASAHMIPAPWDKAAHLSLFALLGVLLKLRWPRLPAPLILVLCALLGLGDEIHQSFVPGRQPDWADGLADILGCSLGLATLHYRQRFFGQAS